MGEMAGYEQSGDYARKVLEQIANERSEYFLRLRIKAIFDEVPWRDRKSDLFPHDQYEIPSVSSRPKWVQKHLVWRKLSENYGAIFSPEGNIDTVFSLTTNSTVSKNNEEGDSFSPRVTTLRDILIESGTDENLCDDVYVGNYRALMEPRMKCEIEETFSIKLSDYSVRTQVVLLNFLSRSTSLEANQIKDILDKGENEKERSMIMNTFLLFEGEDARLSIEYISALLENKEVGMPIINEFNDLINAIAEAEGTLKEMYHGEIDARVLNEVGKKISFRAKLLLKKFYGDFRQQQHADRRVSREGMSVNSESLQGKIKEDQEPENTPSLAQDDLKRKIVAEISSIEKSVLLQFSSFVALKNAGVSVDIEDIKGAEITSRSSEEISAVDRTTMRNIYAKNYTATPNLRDALLVAFDRTFSRPNNSRFSLFKYRDTICGFYCLSEISPSRFSFGAFNIDSAYRGYRLGETMLTQSLERESTKGVIEGDCDQTATISSVYIEQGFVGTHASQFEEVPAIHIVKNSLVGDSFFASRALTRKQIIEVSFVGKIIDKNEMLFIAYPVSEITSIPFSLLDNRESDGSRHVLTRYFRENEGGKETVYAVFEKISEEDFARFDRSSSDGIGK